MVDEIELRRIDDCHWGIPKKARSDMRVPTSVVETVHRAKLAARVAKLRPVGFIKG